MKKPVVRMAVISLLAFAIAGARPLALAQSADDGKPTAQNKQTPGSEKKKGAIPFRPIFDSLERCASDYQRLANAANGLGTTFSVSRNWVHALSRNVGGKATPAAMSAL